MTSCTPCVSQLKQVFTCLRSCHHRSTSMKYKRTKCEVKNLTELVRKLNFIPKIYFHFLNGNESFLNYCLIFCRFFQSCKLTRKMFRIKLQLAELSQYIVKIFGGFLQFLGWHCRGRKRTKSVVFNHSFLFFSFRQNFCLSQKNFTSEPRKTCNARRRSNSSKMELNYKLELKMHN